MGLAPAISNFSRAVAFAGRAHTTNTPNNTWVVFAACVLYMPTRPKSQCMHVRAQLFMSLRTYAGMPVYAHTCALLHNMRMLPRSAHETMHEYVPSPLRSHCRLELILISFSSTRLPQSKSWSPFRRPPWLPTLFHPSRARSCMNGIYLGLTWGGGVNPRDLLL